MMYAVYIIIKSNTYDGSQSCLGAAKGTAVMPHRIKHKENT